MPIPVYEANQAVGHRGPPQGNPHIRQVLEVRRDHGVIRLLAAVVVLFSIEPTGQTSIISRLMGDNAVCIRMASVSLLIRATCWVRNGPDTFAPCPEGRPSR